MIRIKRICFYLGFVEFNYVISIMYVWLNKSKRNRALWNGTNRSKRGNEENGVGNTYRSNIEFAPLVFEREYQESFLNVGCSVTALRTLSNHISGKEGYNECTQQFVNVHRMCVPCWSSGFLNTPD